MAKFLLQVLSLGVVLSLSAVRGAAGQAAPPVGPVIPKPSTVESFEKSFATLLSKQADDQLWERSGPAARSEILKSIFDIQTGLPVGPVTPRPPVPPSSNPSTPPTPPKAEPGVLNPTKSEWDDAIKNLRDALQRSAQSNPSYQLPSATTSEFQRLIDSLTKVSQ